MTDMGVERLEVVEYYDLKSGEIWHFTGDDPLAAYIPAPPTKEDSRDGGCDE